MNSIYRHVNLDLGSCILDVFFASPHLSQLAALLFLCVGLLVQTDIPHHTDEYAVTLNYHAVLGRRSI